jgi:hypothetical protein
MAGAGILRLLVGAGTPREFVAHAAAFLLVLMTADGAALILLTVITDTEAAMLVLRLEPQRHGGSRVSATVREARKDVT